MKFLSHILLFIIILLIAALFPVRNPVITKEESPSSSDITLAQNSTPVEQVIEIPANTWLSGITVWTNRQDNTAPDTPLELSLMRLTPTEEVPYLYSYIFGSVYEGAGTRALRFTFWPTYVPEPTTYRLSLMSPSSPLPLRLQLEDQRGTTPPPHLAYSILATRPLIISLADHILSYDVEGEDFFYYFHRGRQLMEDVNPYECTVDATCRNNKNPGHLPLFYYLSAQTQEMGLTSFDGFLNFWRPLFVTAYVGIGIAIFFSLARRGSLLLAIFGLLFWLLNRWSIYVLRVVQIDFVALLPLVLSVLAFRRAPRLSYVLLGFSLAFKQVAVFIIPLYLILTWQKTPQRKTKELILSLFLLSIVPVTTSLPLFLDSPAGMVKGILYSATRSDEADFGAPALDAATNMTGLLGTVPMLGLMVLIYIAALRKQLSLAAGTLAIFATFLSFNTVIFNQYFIWLLPFVPLALAEIKKPER